MAGHETRVQIKRNFAKITDAVADAATVSTGIDKRGWQVAGFILPTITSVSVGFDVSTDNSTWVALHDPPGTALNLGTTTGSCACSGSALAELAPWPYVRLRFGSATSDCTVTWVLQG
jgi:hypothetical protein